MKIDVSTAIHRTSAVAAVLAAMLSPIPLADELVFLPMYGFLARRIGRVHGLGLGALPWKPIGVTAVSGLAARATVNLSVGFIPGVAAVANATSAVLLTEVLGRYIDAACADPGAARAYGVREFAELLRRKPAEG